MHGHKVITEEAKAKIKQLRKDGVSRGLIAERFGVSKNYISVLIKGRNKMTDHWEKDKSRHCKECYEKPAVTVCVNDEGKCVKCGDQIIQNLEIRSKLEPECQACKLGPGKTIQTNSSGECIRCGRKLNYVPDYISISNTIWDKYFLNICKAVSVNSKCLSRKIGAILIKDNLIVSTGYNGPPKGIPHCGPERQAKESDFGDTFKEMKCPRQLLGYKSGEGLHWCIAAHAERNCLTNASRLGISTSGTTLYLDTQIPCKDCLIELINAGVSEVVCVENKYYDNISKFIIKNSDLKVRKFN